ncbi:MFS transporter [Nocardiopsis lambiniae]|uniref:MFS transporter n=1 Tax=Nocardiopsis lambiniae TaxID=3075539 RepID=A0ABU2M795_9ACTN|nr:MFS transporter [Nocardiopsis sp. DSM 44743]MDT0328548.1 MFS transporter [Nocardiopsis sp. DSM 44743]
MSTSTPSNPPPKGAPRGTPPRGADLARTPLLISIVTSQFGISMVYGAVPGVLLALQVQTLAGDDAKAGVLSLFTAFGAVAALLSQPLAGMLSDRTRSRVGSRTPYVLGGGLIAAPVLWAMGTVDSLLVLAVLYVVSEFVLSAAQGPLAAVLPDRVPAERRGRFSAGLGLGIMLGSVAGTVLASVLSDDLRIAYLVLGCVPVVLGATRLYLAADTDNRGVARPPSTDGMRWWRTFLVSPRDHPDFWWVVGSRMFTYTGFFVVQGYSLYLLGDYVGLGDDAVGQVGIAAGIAALCICLAAVPAGLLSDRVGRRKIFVQVASVTMGVGFMIPLFSPSLPAYLTMVVVTSLAFGCFEAVDTALVTQVLPRSTSFAQDLGVTNVASIAPQILAPAIAGVIVVTTDGYALVFPAAALFAVLGGVTVTRIRGTR